MAAIRKESNGRWTAVVKDGRRYVGAKTFDTKRDAQAWATAEESKLTAGVDLRAGRVRVQVRLGEWVRGREGTVAPGTLTVDADLARVLPRWFLGLSVNAVTEAHVAQLLADWSRTRAHGSMVRYRASLSTFFAHCVRARLVPVSPVAGVRAPRRLTPAVEMHPFTEAEVEVVASEIALHNQRLADVVLIAAWTGLRWGELRALRVGDLIEVPDALLRVQRSTSEGRETKATKSGRSRLVPVSDRIKPLLLAMAYEKAPAELLITTDRGKTLHRTAFLRATSWATTGRGRRIHDLRHTAACLWLARGVSLGTVMTWMGHADISVTNRYVHHLGTTADRAGLALLNVPGANLGQTSQDEVNGTDAQ
ncbi:MAG: site-specific integrase [Aeromicrobium sp.]|nr:site-specific integrase [Aeromicrobium sp.]